MPMTVVASAYNAMRTVQLLNERLLHERRQAAAVKPRQIRQLRMTTMLARTTSCFTSSDFDASSCSMEKTGVDALTVLSELAAYIGLAETVLTDACISINSADVKPDICGVNLIQRGMR